MIKRPTIHRDLLIELGEQALFRHEFLTLETLRYLFVNQTMRKAALNRLAKLTHFILDEEYGRLSERPIGEKGGRFVYLKFGRNSHGMKILKFLVKIMVDSYDSFITNVILNSVRSVDQRALAETLALLKGITHLTFPVDCGGLLRSADAPLYRALIHANAATLQLVRHVESADDVPEVMRAKIVAINHVALRSYSSELARHTETDYLAFYAHGAASTSKVAPPSSPAPGGNERDENDVSGGERSRVAMRLDMHRNTEIFRFAKNNFIRHAVTHLHVRLVHAFDRASVDEILERVLTLRDFWTRLEFLELHLEIMEHDPREDNHNLFGDAWGDDDGGGADEADALVPFAVERVRELARYCTGWLRANHARLTFACNLKLALSVEYNCNASENVEQFLSSVCKQMTACFSGFSLKKNTAKPRPLTIETLGVPDLFARTAVGDRASFELELLFHTLTFSEPSAKPPKTKAKPMAKATKPNKHGNGYGSANGSGGGGAYGADDLDEPREYIRYKDFLML